MTVKDLIKKEEKHQFCRKQDITTLLKDIAYYMEQIAFILDAEHSGGLDTNSSILERKALELNETVQQFRATSLILFALKNLD